MIMSSTKPFEIGMLKAEYINMYSILFNYHANNNLDSKIILICGIKNEIAIIKVFENLYVFFYSFAVFKFDKISSLILNHC